MRADIKNELLLVLVTFIWGSCLVAQKFGLANIGPITFFCARSGIGALFLCIIVLIRELRYGKFAANTDKLGEGKECDKRNAYSLRTTIKGGVCCGIALFLAGATQQIGVLYTTAGKAGFITSLYVVIVPLLGIFMGRRIKLLMIFCTAFTVVGLYLLCVSSGDFSFGNFSIGEVMVLICALFFAIHIIVADKFTPYADSIKMSCVQFATVVVIAFPLMFIIDPKLMVQGQNYHYTMPTFDDLCASAIPLLYAGVLSSGIAYTLQIKAQKVINPVIASLILCCESVFAAVCGAVMLQEMMSIREIIGCIIMFLSIAATKLIQLKGDSK